MIWNGKFYAFLYFPFDNAKEVKVVLLVVKRPFYHYSRALGIGCSVILFNETFGSETFGTAKLLV